MLWSAIRVTLVILVSTKMAGPPELMELERNLAKTLAAVDAFQGRMATN